MRANEVREIFTKFFVDNDHQKIHSASLIPHDETLLFVNSGMVPFKPYFLGETKPDHNRAVSVQKCVRAGGKHNDLDEVGRTARHLTFFEMLGNFSFGDYFKDQAIDFAWEFVTQHLKFDAERLWVTVHDSDDEAETIWREKIGIPADRIQRLDEDNWWRMADTGPNGPCSEIFWDKGPEFGKDGGPAHGDEDRFIEFWNLVFMQFETKESGESVPLAKPCIDTGAGLERILSILQNKQSVFEIDEMERLVRSAEQVTGYKLGKSDNSDLALRVLAEHARTMTFLISDGVFPSNEDRGYVLRRIMRRAIRFAYLLGVEEIVTPTLVESVVDIMGTDYPELVESKDLVLSTVEREEIQFRKTLATGSTILADHLDQVPKDEQLPGSVAFLLHDTYGFPFEVTEEVVAEAGIKVDRPGFEEAMANQREQSKQGRKSVNQESDFGLVQELISKKQFTEFVGRGQLVDVAAKVLLVTESDSGEEVSVFVDRSPFYAESGGQIGDAGTITSESATGEIIDTVYAAPDIHRHIVKVTSGKFETDQSVTLSVDVQRRNAIKRNHTGTHILHWALRSVLGDHVKQQGSMVGPDRLRFDFSHFESVTDEQIVEIENLANSEILNNPSASHVEVTKSEAEEMGAIAFFGDKYGDTVRVLTAGPSLEFCGGTHVNALGDIGCIKIISEGSIGSNLRRIEAVSGFELVNLLRDEQNIISQAATELNTSKPELLSGVQRKNSEVDQLKTELKQAKKQLLNSQVPELVNSAKDGVIITRIDDLDRNDIQELAKSLKSKESISAVVIGGAPASGGACLVAAVEAEYKVAAGDIIASGAKAIGGGGGKGAEFAMAGGKNPAGIDDALEAANKLIHG